MMSRRKKTRERRRHKRFRVQEGTFAVFGGRPGTVGPVIDISMGGLAFRYTGTTELPKEPSRVHIVLPEGLSHLYGLPCTTVYDVELNTSSPFSPAAERRRGVQFGALTPNQRSHLEYFIQYHTQGDA